MRRGRWIAGCLLAAWTLGAAAQTPVAHTPVVRTPVEPGGIVMVTLRPRATVQRGMVTVADVAEIQGGAPALRSQIARLDLAALTASKPEAVLPREQISFRVQLAGIGPKSFRVVGATHVLARLESRSTTELQLTAAQASAPPRTSDEPQPLLVKNRDLVRLRVRIGAFEVTARGEALQDGRAGQSIRVRNVDSNKVVTGRIAGTRVVDVDY